jgi:hypothetical protein
MEDSVFERASIRFASFVGDEEGEEGGVIDSKILVKSRVSRGVFCDEPGGDGVARFGDPYVLTTLLDLGGSSTISTDIFLRFLG